jgi:F-type H+/Na+-transporting ATPase subunit alpha
MSSLIESLHARLDRLGADAPATTAHIGRVIQVADGVARVEGLSKVMYHERVEFAGGASGLALNLEEDVVGVVILGHATGVHEGEEVRTTGQLMSVPVGMELLGRVIDPLGQPLDGKGALSTKAQYPIERIAPGIIARKSVTQPLQTGITAIDSMIPIGRGQRELIIGDRATGKTTIAIDTIINQAAINRANATLPGFRPVYSIYVAIGQKSSTLARTIATLEKHRALEYTIIVVASASENPANQYLAPYAGCAIGEYFMENGKDALIVYDDLSKHAVAYRQISLILKRPSGREAYPGDVFYLHSRLLERAARLNENHGGGSLTALPIIETQAGDVAAYIPTNVISITDGQIYLETDLFNQGTRPAISVGLSVSRVGSAAQIKAYKQVAGKIKLELAQYRELAAFAQFGSDLDAKTKQQLDRGARIVELFKQAPNSPLGVAAQVSLLWAVQNSFFDSIPVPEVKAASDSYTHTLTTRHSELMEKILLEGKLTDDIISALKAATELWKSSR